MATHIKLLLSIVYVYLIIYTNTKVLICNPDDTTSCQDQTYQCKESDCEIQCKTESSCTGLTIQCPTRGTCTIQCLAERSCEQITIHAESAASLNIKLIDSRNVITQSHIYVPNTGTHTKTTIDCGEGTVCSQMNIYSKYGLSDINLSCRSTDCLLESVLYCQDEKEAYTQSCPITCERIKYTCTCESNKHICNNLYTPKPTLTPTRSTLAPSKYPTNIPTNIPTKEPSINPTIMPTPSPVREGEANDNPNVVSNAKNNGNDSMNNQQQLGGAASILYVGIIGMVLVLCVVVVGYLFCRQRNKNKKNKMKLEMETMQMKNTKVYRISSMSAVSHLSDNEVTNGMHVLPITTDGTPLSITPTTTPGRESNALSVTNATQMTPNGGLLIESNAVSVTDGFNNVSDIHEGQNEHEEEIEDMYDDNIMKDGNEMVTETGGVMTPNGSVCMQINEQNDEKEDLDVENESDSNLLDEES
eukprot:490983_1